MKSALRLIIAVSIISLSAFLANCGGFQPSPIQGGTEAGNPPTDGQVIGGTEAGNPPSDHPPEGTAGGDPHTREGETCGPDGKTADGQDCDPTKAPNTDKPDELTAIKNTGPLPHPDNTGDTTDKTPNLGDLHRDLILAHPDLTVHPDLTMHPELMKTIPQK